MSIDIGPSQFVESCIVTTIIDDFETVPNTRFVENTNPKRN